MNENELSHAIIGAAIEVHREIGPGIIEKPYEEAMCHELHLRGLPFVRQKLIESSTISSCQIRPQSPPTSIRRPLRLCVFAFSSGPSKT